MPVFGKIKASFERISIPAIIKSNVSGNLNTEVIHLAKKGMKRPEIDHGSKNDVAPVPEIQGRAKTTKEKAKPITEK